jgi:Protein of unknown function (DUF1236)
MKSIFFAGLAALALAGPAFAQSTTVVTTPGPSAGATVTIAPDQRTRIKQYVVQNKVKPFALRERMAVGTTLPPDVELSVVPNEWGPGLTQYRYVYSNNYIGFVDPSSRRVIEVID